MKKLIVFANLAIISLYAMDDSVRRNLSEDSNVNVANINEVSPPKSEFDRADLILAIENGDTKKVKSLLRKGVFADSADSNGITPLMIASKLGHVDIINLLLNFKADASKEDKNQNTALMWWLLNNDDQDQLNKTEVVKQFIQRCPSIIQHKNAKGETALTFAWNNGYVNLAKVLIDYETNFSYDTLDYFETELIKNDSDLKYEMFDYIRKVSAFSEELELSIKSGNLESVKDLLSKVECLKGNSSRFINLAITSEDIKDNDIRLAIVKELLIKGANPNMIIDGDKYPLSIVIEQGNWDLINLLSQYEAYKTDIFKSSPNSNDNKEKTQANKNKNKKRWKNTRTEDIRNKLPQFGENLVIDIDENFSDESDSEPNEKVSNGLSQTKINAGKKLFDENKARIKLKAVPLIHAVFSGNLRKTKFLLSSGHDVNVRNSDLVTPLMYAAYNCDERMINLLLKHGADVNLQDKNKNTALLWAMIFKNRNDDLRARVVQNLINSDSKSVSLKNKLGETPLSLAWQFNYENTSKVLIDNGADYGSSIWEKRKEEIKRNHELNKTDEVKERILLHYYKVFDLAEQLKATAEKADLSKFRSLLQGKKVKGLIGQRLLKLTLTSSHCTNELGRKEIISDLLSYGLDPNFQYGNKKTLLMLASTYGMKDIVEILLNKDIDIDAQDKNGNTALIVAAANNHEDIIDLLTQRGANVNLMNKNGYDVKHFASMRKIDRSLASIRDIDNLLELLKLQRDQEEQNIKEEIEKDIKRRLNLDTQNNEEIEKDIKRRLNLDTQNNEEKAKNSDITQNQRTNKLKEIKKQQSIEQTLNKKVSKEFRSIRLEKTLLNSTLNSENNSVNQKVKRTNEERSVEKTENEQLKWSEIVKQRPTSPSQTEANFIKIILASDTDRKVEKTENKQLKRPEMVKRKQNTPSQTGINSVKTALAQDKKVEKTENKQPKWTEVVKRKPISPSQIEANSIKIALAPNKTNKKSDEKIKRDTELKRKTTKELRAALINGQLGEFKSLLEKSDIKGEVGYSLFKLALSNIFVQNNNKKLDVIRMLLDKGVEPNAKYDRGKTFLMIAVMNNSEEIVKLLLERGARVNDRNQHGNTALIIASTLGLDNIVKILLENGANKEIKNKQGYRARHFALLKGYNNIAEMLKTDSNDQDTPNNNEANKDLYSEIAIESSKEDIVESTISESKSKNRKKKVAELKSEQITVEEEKLLAELKDSVISGDIDKFRLLRNQRDIKGYVSNELLRLAVTSTLIEDINQRINMVIELLEKGADSNSTYNNGKTILMLATNKKCEEIVDLLIDNGANINARDKLGNTALMIAAANDYIDLVSKLMYRGAKVDQKNNRGKTAEDFASLKGFNDIVEIICNADELTATKTSKAKKLFEAIDQKKRKLIEQLLDEDKGLIRETDEEGNNPLLKALSNGNSDIGSLFLTYDGLNINHINKKGDSALALAIKLKNKLLIDFISSYASKKQVILADPGNKVFLSALNLNYLNIVKTLLSNKNIEIKDIDGNSPLLIALKNEMNRPLVEFLISRNADVNVSNNEGKTPLIRSLELNDPYITKIFVKKGADVNKKDNENNSPLLLALRNKDFDTAWFLITEGAELEGIEEQIKDDDIKEIFESLKIYHLALIDKTDINVKNDKGETAVIRAVKYGPRKILEQLIKEGADLNITDSDNKTPLFIAMKNNKKGIAALLLKNKANLRNGDTGIEDIKENNRSAIIDALKSNSFEKAWKFAKTGINLDGIDEKLTDDNAKYLLDTIRIYQKALLGTADIDTQYTDGDTAVMRAVKCNHTNIIDQLLKKEANFDIPDDNGNSFVLIVTKNNLTNLIDICQTECTEFDIVNSEGDTPLLLATKNNNQQAFNAIISSELKRTSIKDKDGNTPLHYALINKNFSMIKDLLKKGARLEEIKEELKDPDIRKWINDQKRRK